MWCWLIFEVLRFFENYKSLILIFGSPLILEEPQGVNPKIPLFIPPSIKPQFGTFRRLSNNVYKFLVVCLRRHHYQGRRENGGFYLGPR
jgi:hypothetical protein